MISDLEVIKAIVDAFERSDWSEIDVRSGPLRVHLSTQAQGVGDSGRADPPVQPAASTPDDADDAPPAGAVVVPAGAHVVQSPSPGIFWRSPHPGAPPFADVGDHVEASSTLCIVEVMKLMNHIGAGIPGTVVAVLVENGMRVDRGDRLFAIQPTASP